MTIKKKYVLLTIVIVLTLLCGLVGTLTNWFGIAKEEAVDFIQEQQTGADSAGELIGMQYSQLRELSIALDTMACQLDLNESEIDGLKKIYGNDPTDWSDATETEMRNLREYRRGVLQRYAAVASEYNNLKSDIRTLPDDIGLTVENIPQAEELSPVEGMCGSFALPETETE